MWVESAGTQLTERPRVKSAQFGDGYQQLAPDGINSLAQEWEMVFDGVDDTVADDMVAFLRTQGGTQPFNYVPLRTTDAISVICAEWSRSFGPEPGISSLRATFKQWFGP